MFFVSASSVNLLTHNLWELFLSWRHFNMSATIGSIGQAYIVIFVSLLSHRIMWIVAVHVVAATVSVAMSINNRGVEEAAVTMPAIFAISSVVNTRWCYNAPIAAITACVITFFLCVVSRRVRVMSCTSWCHIASRRTFPSTDDAVSRVPHPPLRLTDFAFLLMPRFQRIDLSPQCIHVAANNIRDEEMRVRQSYAVRNTMNSSFTNRQHFGCKLGIGDSG